MSLILTLSAPQKILWEIEKRIEKARVLKSLVEKTTQTFGRERVRGSANPNKIEDALCELLDLEKEVEELISEYSWALDKAYEAISHGNKTTRDVLRVRYINGISARQTAKQLGLSDRRVWQICAEFFQKT